MLILWNYVIHFFTSCFRKWCHCVLPLYIGPSTPTWDMDAWWRPKGRNVVVNTYHLGAWAAVCSVFLSVFHDITYNSSTCTKYLGVHMFFSFCTCTKVAYMCRRYSWRGLAKTCISEAPQSFMLNVHYTAALCTPMQQMFWTVSVRGLASDIL